MRRIRAQPRRLRVCSCSGHRLWIHSTEEFSSCDLTGFFSCTLIDTTTNGGSAALQALGKAPLQDGAAKGQLVCMMARRSFNNKDITIHGGTYFFFSPSAETCHLKYVCTSRLEIKAMFSGRLTMTIQPPTCYLHFSGPFPTIHPMSGSRTTIKPSKGSLG